MASKQQHASDSFRPAYNTNTKSVKSITTVSAISTKVNGK